MFTTPVNVVDAVSTYETSAETCTEADWVVTGSWKSTPATRETTTSMLASCGWKTGFKAVIVYALRGRSGIENSPCAFVSVDRLNPVPFVDGLHYGFGD